MMKEGKKCEYKRHRAMDLKYIMNIFNAWTLHFSSSRKLYGKMF